MTHDPPMNAKRKAASSKETWQAMRACYTWHLRPPFDQEFDHSHWWKNEPRIDPAPAAALYELARRHPRVGELRSRLHHASWYGQELRAPLVGAAKDSIVSRAFDDLGQEPAAMHCLCLIGLKTWPTLDCRDQASWKMSAGNMKGVDCRDDLERCYSITLNALDDVHSGSDAWIAAISKNAKVRVVRQQAFQKVNEFLAKRLHEEAWQKAHVVVTRLPKKPPTSAEMEEALAEAAIAAHRQGFWLFAVAPDLGVDEATSLLSHEYSGHALLNRRPKKRARSRNWLKIISEFENAETSSGGTNASGFNPYRAIMDSIRFVSSQEPVSKLVPPK